MGRAESGKSVQAFLRGKTYEVFVEDDLVRSAVERQLQIIAKHSLSSLGSILGSLGMYPNCAVFSPSATSSCMDTPRSTTIMIPYHAIKTAAELQVNLQVLLRASDPERNQCER